MTKHFDSIVYNPESSQIDTSWCKFITPTYLGVGSPHTCFLALKTYPSVLRTRSKILCQPVKPPSSAKKKSTAVFENKARLPFLQLQHHSWPAYRKPGIYVKADLRKLLQEIAGKFKWPFRVTAKIGDAKNNDPGFKTHQSPTRKNCIHACTCMFHERGGQVPVMRRTTRIMNC